MKRLRALPRMLRSDRGATAVEYGFIVAGVAALAIPALVLIRDNSESTFATTVEAQDGVTVCAEGDPNCTAFNALPAANLPGVPSVTTLAASSPKRMKSKRPIVHVRTARCSMSRRTAPS